jgi:hypothetical protein
VLQNPVEDRLIAAIDARAGRRDPEPVVNELVAAFIAALKFAAPARPRRIVSRR